MASMHDSFGDGWIDVALVVVGGAVERKPACDMVAIKRASGMHRTPEIVVFYTNVLTAPASKSHLTTWRWPWQPVALQSSVKAFLGANGKGCAVLPEEAAHTQLSR